MVKYKTKEGKTMRNYTKIASKEYEREEIDKAVPSLEWEEFRRDNLPFSQGEAIKNIIQGCNVPLSKIKKMALHGCIKESHGFYGLDVDYKNGNAKLYIADNGCSCCVVASDFVAC
jgi:hypothetical protein